MLKFLICGPGGSGKDHLRKKLQKKGLTYSVSCTTRPPREHETHGVDYYFITEDEFNQKIKNNEFAEWEEFNNWKYGTLKQELEKSQIFVTTVYGINQLSENIMNNSFIIYLNPPEEIRRKRLSTRKDADSVERRIISDRRDFENFNLYDIKITNEDF